MRLVINMLAHTAGTYSLAWAANLLGLKLRRFALKPLRTRPWLLQSTTYETLQTLL